MLAMRPTGVTPSCAPPRAGLANNAWSARGSFTTARGRALEECAKSSRAAGAAVTSAADAVVSTTLAALCLCRLSIVLQLPGCNRSAAQETGA
jgi:hypothetical protein